MPNPNTNRRQFMKASLFVLLALPFTGLLRNALAAKKEPKPEPLPAGASAVPATDAVAIAIGYKADVKDVDFVKYPLRKKPEAKTQFCKNCALYTATNGSWGKCQMLTSGLVTSQGWCGSWSKKA